MKTKLTQLTTLCLLCGLLFSLPGCGTLKGIYNAGTYTTTAQTADQLIANAEKAAEIGQEVMVSFVHQEKDHRALFAKLGTKPAELSVWLREQVPDPYDAQLPGDPPTHAVPRLQAILATVRIATKAFEANRTPNNEANLRTAWQALQSVLDSCKSFKTAAMKGQ